MAAAGSGARLRAPALRFSLDRLAPVFRFALLLLAPVALAGCSDLLGDEDSDPSPLVSVAVGDASLEFWPFTGVGRSGNPEDPINLVFAGPSDPGDLRAPLLLLDGDRTAFGFSNAFPFNCRWRDAIGVAQTAFARPDGWVTSALQLECGDFNTVRFHARFFDVGSWTLANAHLEVLIPGTSTAHQVISWELAEDLIVFDFLRSGILSPATPFFQSGEINASPYDEIPVAIYNGLPPDLRAAIGGPQQDVSDPVPIATDGRATVLVVEGG
jgi:hypothetical protein